MMAAMAIILFPKLALGLSGFETGVAVMPLVRGDDTDTEEYPVGRIRNTKKLLSTAALIMSVMLIASSFVSVLLIPAGGVPAGSSRPTAARSRIWRTSSWAPHFGTALRPQHDRHPLVRRRVRAWRAC